MYLVSCNNSRFTLSIVSTDMHITRSGRRSTAEICPYAADGSLPRFPLCKAHHILSLFPVASKPFPTEMTSPPPVGPCRSVVSIMARQNGPHRESRPLYFAALNLLKLTCFYYVWFQCPASVKTLTPLAKAWYLGTFYESLWS